MLGIAETVVIAECLEDFAEDRDLNENTDPMSDIEDLRQNPSRV